MEKRLRRFPDQIYFFGLLPAISLLPPALGYWLIRRQGRRLQSSLADHDQAIRRNLALCGFRDPGPIARSFFEIMAAEDMEAYYFKSWNQSNIDRYFDFVGTEFLEKSLAGGRGAILISGHLGCVSSALVAMGIKRLPITHVSRGYPWAEAVPTPFLRYARKKIRWIEQKMGTSLIYSPTEPDPLRSATASLEILGALRANRLVSMAIDLLPSMAPQRSTAEFLGRTCSFAVNFLKVAYQCGAPVIPYFNIRDSGNWIRQRLTFEAPVPLTGDLHEDLQSCVMRFERVVRSHPEQWFSWDSLSAFWSES